MNKLDQEENKPRDLDRKLSRDPTCRYRQMTVRWWAST
jgi:hypothetical protein